VNVAAGTTTNTTTGYSGPTTDYGLNPYINSVPGNVNDPNSTVPLIGLTNGTSNTILLGHIYFAISEYPQTTANGSTLMPLFSPGTLGTSRSSLGNTAATYLQDGTASSSNQWGSPMVEGGLMAMADGSVRMFPYGTPLTNFLQPNSGVTVVVPN